MKNMKKIYFLFIFLLLAGVLFYSCKNITKDEASSQSSGNQGFSDDDIDFEGSVSVFYMFPSPMEILEQFEETELNYVPGLINDAGNSEKYLTSKARALNLGIYITDLAYTSLLGRTSEAMEYPEIIQSLSADLGISNESFKNIIKRVQDNINVKDSLIEISNDLYFALIEYLETGGQTTTIAEISSGAYIETMFIGLNSVDSYSVENAIVKQIIDMKYPFENLVAQAETTREEGSSNALLDYLNQLKSVFDELEPDQSDTEIIRNEDGEISITGGMSFAMNEENFNEMKSRATRIRTKITESSN